MSLNFRNMGVSISGKDSSLTSSYYADSISVSESLSALNFGTLGSNQVATATAKAPEGSLDVSFYITTGQEITAITGHYGRTGFIEVQAGPFKVEDALLQSFNFSVDPLGLIMGSMGYQYYGQLKSGSAAPLPSSPTIKPAHGATSSVQAASIGVSGVLSATYDFSQSYDVGFSIGSSKPARVTFQEMTKSLDIEAQAQDVNFEQSSLTGTSGICLSPSGTAGFSPKSGIVSLKNLCSEQIGVLDVVGFLERRGFDSAPNTNVAESLSIVSVSREGEC